MILLTKADLEGDPESVAAAEEIGGAVPVHAVSSPTGLGLDATGRSPGGGHGSPRGPVRRGQVHSRQRAPRRGPSGDGGRATTDPAGTRQPGVSSSRSPGGGLVVDNPGMRELHLWLADEGLEGAFEDVVELAAQCRFSDCRHEGEPVCAIEAALADGRLARERWDGYRDLQRELAELEAKLERRERSAPGEGGRAGGS